MVQAYPEHECKMRSVYDQMVQLPAYDEGHLAQVADLIFFLP